MIYLSKNSPILPKGIYCPPKSNNSGPNTTIDYDSYHNSVNFGSTLKVTYINSEKIRHQTHFFRKDMDWNTFADKVINKFPKGAKIYCYGCSDGSEPYSIALELQKKLGKKEAAKFLPIYARDISPSVIKSAKQGIIELSSNDLEVIKKHSDQNFDDLFTLANQKKYPPKYYIEHPLIGAEVEYLNYEVSDSLRKSVIFDVSDITKDAKQKFPKDTVLLFRNGWYQLSEDNQIDLAKDLRKNLHTGSLLVTGSCEADTQHKLQYERITTNKLLTRTGFIPKFQYHAETKVNCGLYGTGHYSEDSVIFEKPGIIDRIKKILIPKTKKPSC